MRDEEIRPSILSVGCGKDGFERGFRGETDGSAGSLSEGGVGVDDWL